MIEVETDFPAFCKRAQYSGPGELAWFNYCIGNEGDGLKPRLSPEDNILVKADGFGRMVQILTGT